LEDPRRKLNQNPRRQISITGRCVWRKFYPFRKQNDWGNANQQVLVINHRPTQRELAMQRKLVLMSQ
jgi:hypothetical protein